MKISPVQGTPTISQPTSTGLSPEKLQRLKSIASGTEIEKVEEAPKGDLLAQLTKTPSIKMLTNKTVNREGQVDSEAPSTESPAIESGISDVSAQAEEGSEVTRPLSPQLAELARQRRALQVKQRELEEREKALSGQNKGQDLEARLKSSPLSVLQELGVTYDQLTNEILQSQNGNAEVLALKAELEALKKGIDTKFAEKDTAQEEAVFSHMKLNVDRLSDGSEYRLIKESKSQDDVLDLIRRSWKEKGEVLDEEEAMQLVEKELREDARRYAKLIQEIEPTTQTPAGQKPIQQQGMKTLTNKDTAKPLMNRRQRAIAAALGQLPKG